MKVKHFGSFLTDQSNSLWGFELKKTTFEMPKWNLHEKNSFLGLRFNYEWNLIDKKFFKIKV